MKNAALIGAAFLLLACTSIPEEPANESAFKQSNPCSILVMPPVNLSPEVSAPITFLATSAYPLAESGYYVIPVALSTEIFRQNGVTVAEEAQAIPTDKLWEIFGADSALYISILRFGSSYQVLESVVEAQASAKLIDLRNGTLLWSGKVNVRSGSGSDVSSVEGLVASMIGAAIGQIANSLSNKSFEIGKQANYQLLSAGKKNSIPYGPYSSKYVP